MGWSRAGSWQFPEGARPSDCEARAGWCHAANFGHGPLRLRGRGRHVRSLESCPRTSAAPARVVRRGHGLCHRRRRAGRGERRRVAVGTGRHGGPATRRTPRAPGGAWAARRASQSGRSSGRRADSSRKGRRGPLGVAPAVAGRDRDCGGREAAVPDPRGSRGRTRRAPCSRGGLSSQIEACAVERAAGVDRSSSAQALRLPGTAQRERRPDRRAGPISDRSYRHGPPCRRRVRAKRGRASRGRDSCRPASTFRPLRSRRLSGRPTGFARWPARTGWPSGRRWSYRAGSRSDRASRLLSTPRL